jgi:hypothetical protein
MKKLNFLFHCIQTTTFVEKNFSFLSKNTLQSNPHYKTQLSFDAKFLFDFHWYSLQDYTSDAWANELRDNKEATLCFGFLLDMDW